ncbi:MAG: ABC transporter permease [Gammaproteobacteria bacterium]
MTNDFQRQWIAFYAIVKGEVLRYFRVWTQSLMPPAVTMTLYFVVFGTFVGSQISHINGYTYMQFIAPGLIMMSMIMSAYNNTSFSFYVARFHRNIEEMLVAPIPNWIILSGYTIAGVIRGLMVGVIVSVIALFFTHFSPKHYLFIVLGAIFATTFFSLAGFTNGVFAKRFDDISMIPTFILAPLIYLGGVFYSVNQLPPIWQKVSMVNPILYIIETFRYGFLGIVDMNVYWGLFMLFLFVVLLFLYNLRLLNRGVNIKA